jgi:hypothetical protein
LLKLYLSIFMTFSHLLYHSGIYYTSFKPAVRASCNLIFVHRKKSQPMIQLIQRILRHNPSSKPPPIASRRDHPMLVETADERHPARLVALPQIDADPDDESNHPACLLLIPFEGRLFAAY